MSSYGTIGGYLPEPTEVTGGGDFPFGGGANYGFDMSNYQMPGGGIDMSGAGASGAIAGLGALAGGGGAIEPSIWGDTEAQIRNMFNQRGGRVDTTPQWQAAKAVGYDNLDDMLDAAMERYSAGNMRFGSGHVGAAADTAGQVGNQLAQYYAEKEYQSQTDALNRYLQSMGLGTQLGSAQGDFRLGNTGQQLQALLGQGNLSLGQASQALANDQAAYGQLMDALGLTQNYGQGALDRLYADWNAAQGMPYLEGAQQFSSAGNFRPGQFYQTQGALGTIGSVLGGIGGLATGIGAIPGIIGGIGGMFGGGGNKNLYDFGA